MRYHRQYFCLPPMCLKRPNKENTQLNACVDFFSTTVMKVFYKFIDFHKLPEFNYIQFKLPKIQVYHQKLIEFSIDFMYLTTSNNVGICDCVYGLRLRKHLLSLVQTTYQITALIGFHRRIHTVNLQT